MNKIDKLKQRVIENVDIIHNDLIQIADLIFVNPETAFEEYKSSALLANALEEEGFSVRRGIAGLKTSFVASLNGKTESPRIAFLAEYDALPQLGHACGHNLIGTSAVGAALAIKSILTELNGSVHVIGSPAEEGGGGKAIMVEAGVFELIDAALMVHPSTHNTTRRGSLSSCKITLEFFGKSAHAAAAPEKGINAFDALILAFTGINALRQHLRSDARVHGIITHGGEATNIVPEYSAAKFGVRAMDVPYTRQIIDKVKACAEAGALVTGARLKFTEGQYHYAPMCPNPVLADLVDSNMRKLGIDVKFPIPNKGGMGSTDMGNVSQAVPALHPYIAIGPETVSTHTNEFRELAGSAAGHVGMIKAAKIMSMTAIDLLACPEILTAVKTAFIQEPLNE
ncbi:MAG TPA: amidohydrolase [Spirochaetia bacterium]|nr:amidohydrolase [Spirochaetia bacterium]